MKTRVLPIDTTTTTIMTITTTTPASWGRESVDAIVSDDPVDISPSSLLMTKTGVDENDMAEVSVVDKTEEEKDMVWDCG